MTQIHLVFRRINPALKVDFVQVGHIVNGQFVDLPVSVLGDTDFPEFLMSEPISDNHLVSHSSISTLVSYFSSFPNFVVEYFDNTLVLMFDFNIDSYESTSEEEKSGR